LICNLTDTLISLQVMQVDAHRNWSQLVQYMTEHGISVSLRARIKILITKQATMPFQPESDVTLLSSIPKGILDQLHEEAYMPLVCSYPLFESVCVSYSSMCRQLCTSAVHEQVARPEGTIFSTGDLWKQMILIRHGKLAYEVGKRTVGVLREESCCKCNTDREIFALAKARSRSHAALADGRFRVEAGQGICEAALWMRWYNYGELTSFNFALWLSITADDFAKVVKVSPEMHRTLIVYSNEFVRALQDRSHIDDFSGIF